MNKTLPTLALLAAALAGCGGPPKAPPVVYNPVDVIASGRPPLLFSVSRPGALNVIDVTTQSRIFHVDLTSDVIGNRPELLRLDPDLKALTVENRAATQPSDKYVQLLPIDPTHIYAVEFAPDYKTTPPATQPSGK